MTNTSNLLQVTGLTAGYVSDVDVLFDVSLHVGRGEMVTVIGPNGAGKSTLVRSITGMLHPRSGTILFDGTDLVGKPGHAIALSGLGYVPQRNNIFPSLTVVENLELGLAGRSRRLLAERLNAVYRMFPHLDERRRQRAGTLSGGERQMLALGRALMGDPRLLVLDEPSAGLAPVLIDGIFDRIREIRRAGVAVLLVEQNARQALSLSDRGYVLDLGRNRFEGPGPELLSNPRIAELYLGAGSRNRGVADSSDP